ncbi:MAG: hypothetical protein IJS39_02265 [Synergistaceae bacterium]|nr:hypothetical protein [Synergistaceae bacterium]
MVIHTWNSFWGWWDSWTISNVWQSVKDKSYREELLKVKKKVLVEAMDSQNKRKDGLLRGLTDWGELYTGIQDTILESKGIDQFSTLPEIAPAVSGLADTTAGEKNILGMVKAAAIPKGGRFTSHRKRSYGWDNHNGLDLSAPEGTDIVMRDYGTLLTVKSVNTATPSKGLRNSITLTGTYSDGTTIEVSLGHMMDNSIRVMEGQTLHVGDIIGKVSNIGMTSGREKGGIMAWYEGKRSGYHFTSSPKA